MPQRGGTARPHPLKFLPFHGQRSSPSEYTFGKRFRLKLENRSDRQSANLASNHVRLGDHTSEASLTIPPRVMTGRPIIFPPASPVETLTYALERCSHPTTLIIGSSKEAFLHDLTEEARSQLEGPEDEEVHGNIQAEKLSILRRTLQQVATSRHIRVAFTPSVTHLRAWLAAFSPSSLRNPPPPVQQLPQGCSLLLVYGLVDLHRDTSEWSAQGLGNTLSTLIEVVARYEFRPVLLEVKQNGVTVELDALQNEKLPILNGAARNDDGSWSGRCTELGRVLGRWFDFEDWESVSKSRNETVESIS